jgi:hypothetical protein
MRKDALQNELYLATNGNAGAAWIGPDRSPPTRSSSWTRSWKRFLLAGNAFSRWHFFVPKSERGVPQLNHFPIGGKNVAKF